MVTRRRDNHTVRISAMPKEKIVHGGIYYHVSFYDLQAANHITMLPNSMDFVNTELTEVIHKNAVDYWVINCSNIRPHAYFLDAVRKKWYNKYINDETHSREFADTYFGDNARHDSWYRDAVYASDDRRILTLLANDNHMKDCELYKTFKKKEGAD